MLDIVRVQRETVQEQVYLALRDKLMRGGFQPGQKLKLNELAEAFGVSAMPIREALSRLTAERGLESLPNKTIRVPALRNDRLEDLRQARFAVEGLAVARAAETMTPEAIAALETLVSAQNETDEHHFSEASAEQNRAFHFTIYRQSGSTVLLPIIESLWLQFGPYLRDACDRFDGRDGRGAYFHTKLVEALSRRDAAAARAALEADIGRAFDLVMAKPHRQQAQSGAV